ncbi:GntR family transcriptional regulator [Granulicella cerasi]|uniref:GntR family transcriptional regulator n=1 Tax=Granulicella cerasi TaxID=741063 RepID=A0ABW1Z9E6_9BACT|nr:GntR family transcriptional regulator [Granulicella cerasi]
MSSSERRPAVLRPSLASQAYTEIRDRILKGEIELGEVISRRGLAADLGMSFIPVSEAMQRLEAEGMLESLPRVGTRVRIPTPNDVRDCYIIREALEVQSARLFCERASAMEREELSAMARRLDSMAKASAENQFEFQTLHVRFHMRIAECTGCVPLYELLERNQVLIFNWLFDVAADSSMPGAWHGDLIDIINGGDPDKAALAMGVHIRTGMSEIQSSIAERFGNNLSWMQRRPKEAASTVKKPRTRSVAI